MTVDIMRTNVWDLNPNYYVYVSEGWGLSKSPGSLHFLIYTDGRYVRKKILEGPDGGVTITEGKLNNEVFAKLKEFVEERCQKSTSVMMMDYGCGIEVKDSEKYVNLDNDMGAFHDIIKIIPFKDSEK